ncbi:GNAT family N-acetyltransferase [Microbacterium sp. B35-30]|uniref:GNAT family N-acetyltransferase n=1 Tax=Microbacterium sp. B35-30 TaxID=1962642 RepID=UPI0013D2158B|nr:GNAT family N-acetyltransferase [Microbacterium sp. B35-30]KAF2420872.1 GNAT family N-acetyltransferase [Microbacterium sp. B35-30]
MSIAFDIRHLGGTHEIELFNRIPYALNDEIADDLEQGRRRVEWTWLAIHEDRLLGRLALWSPSGSTDATQFDILDLDDALSDDEQREVGAALLDAAHGEAIAGQATPPEFARYLPADWRERRAERRATETIMALLEASGARFVVERLRLQWEPKAGIPTPDPRLDFRAFEDDDEVLDLTTRALTGTLDAHSRGELGHATPQEVARAQFDEEFARYTTPREWWRVAVDGAGEAVGFVFPARNSYHHIVAYVGVLPEHRGNGYVDGILAEGTRVLAEAGAPHIRASTDVGNLPMANAFARAGYSTFQRLINMEWN